ncbi:MAG: CDP-alcohol phosphatidyltransferase family protein [Actinomycetota bacterium]|jgi:CDP-diacylglycerol---glycerol-3-phosphate 3-phosphatidyltransferase
MTPANAITLTRVLATPFLVALILSEEAGWGLVGFWTVLAISDVFDGWLARRHGATRSGAFLDPLADKIVVLAAMAALVSVGRLWWLPVVVMGLREVAISAYRSYVGRRGVSVPARPLAKAKTWAQAITVFVALVPAEGRGFDVALAALVWVAVALTLVTGSQYLWDGRRVIHEL